MRETTCRSRLDELGRVGSERLGRRVHTGERLVVNPDQRRRSVGVLDGVGEHDRHGIAGEANVVVTEDRLVGRRPPVGVEARGRLWGRIVADIASARGR